MKKRLFSLLLVFAMVFSMLPTYTLAAEEITYDDKDLAAEETGVTASKTVTDNGDGTYTITLSVLGYTQNISTTTKLPADIVLVVDTSRSMTNNVTCGGAIVDSTCTVCGHVYSLWVPNSCNQTVTRLQVAKAAAKSFVNGLLESNDNINVGLCDFNSSTRTTVALTNNAATLNNAIDGMTTQTGTHYDVGLDSAADILEGSTEGRKKFVVFISDGEPTNRHEGASEAEELMKDDVTIFTVAVDADDAIQYLENISSADENGDKYCYAASSSGDSGNALTDVLAQIQQTIQSSINAGTDAEITDIVAGEFEVTGALAEGLSSEGKTVKWDIDNITSEEKTISFKITPSLPLTAGKHKTNDDVKLTFTDPEGKKIIFSELAIGSPEIEIFGVTVTANSDTVTYNGAEQTVSGYTVTDGYTVEGITASGTGTDAGTYDVTFDGTPVVKDAEGKDITYKCAITLVPGTLKIDPRAIQITADSGSKIYDGEPLVKNSYAVTSGKLADGDEFASVTVTGSQTVVGESANVPSAAVIMDGETDVTGNYAITYVNGTLTVIKDEKATIEVVGYNGIYDGAYHDGITSVIIKNSNGDILDNDDWTITYTYGEAESSEIPQFKDAGTYDNILVRAENQNYNTLSVSATATITPKVVTIVSPTASKTYDGIPLEATDFEVEGFVDGEGVTFKDYASITDVGSIYNSISYEANEGTNLKNYSVSETEGTLTVLPITSKLVITADSNEKVYDGTPLTDNGYTYTEGILAEGDVLTAVVEGTITNVGDVKNEVKSYVIMRDNDDVTRNYTNIQTVDGTLTVTKRSATLTSAGATKEYDGTPLTAETITQGGFVAGEGVVASSFASITNVGSAENTFEYTAAEGTDLNNYDITVTYGTLQVTASDDAVLTVNGYNNVYDGSAHTVNYSIAGAVDGTEWTYEYKVGDGDYTSELPAFTDVTEKTVTVKATNPNYTTLEESAQVIITPRKVTLTSGSASRPYDGTALKNESVAVSGEGFVDVEGASYSDFASIKEVTESPADNTFVYTLNKNTKAENYTITVVYGTLEIKKYTETLTVTANSGSKTYDGQPLVDNGFAHNNKLAAGDVLAAVVEGTITDVGYVENVVKSVIITRDGKDVTANYANIQTVNGKLTVNPAQVTITSGDAEKMYDGTPLTKEEVTATGFIGKDASAVKYTFTGSQTNVGESDNTFTYELAEEIAHNYEITTVYGKLTVTQYTDAITIHAASDEKMYDGTPLSKAEYLYTGTLVEGDHIEAVVEGEITNVGVAENKVTSYKIVRGDEDVTSNYQSVTAQNGTLKVTARDVILTSATDYKYYDGTPLTNDEITVSGSGFVEGEGVVCEVTGSQTDAGTSKNTFTYEMAENTIAENYSISTEEGTLTVFAAEGIVITITENSGEYDYDGDEKTVEGYEVTSISDPLYTEDDFTFNGEAVVSGTEPGVYDMELTPDMFENTNANFDNVTFVVVNGTLTINPQVTVEYYIEDEDGNRTKIDPIDDGQDNPFTVGYGDSWTIVIGDEGGNYHAPETIEYNREEYIFDEEASDALSDDSITENVTVELVYVIEEDDFYIPIIKDGTLEISKELTAPEGFTGDTTFTFEIYRTSGTQLTYVTAVEVDADDSEKIKLPMGRYLVVEVDAEEEGYDLTTICSDDDHIVRIDGGKRTSVVFENIYAPAVELEKDDHFGYIIGYPDNTVRPEESVTRAEVATIFFRMLTDDTRDYYWTQENDFSDVSEDDWFNNAVSTLANAGVINGYSDGTFRPNEPISRAELVKIAVTFYNFDATLAKFVFTDVEGHWAEAFISEAVNLAFINGYTDGSFKPDNDITRAEAMKLINRTLNRIPDADHLHDDMIVWADNMDEDVWYYAEVQEATNSHYYEWIDESYENWLEILPVRDWAALEKSWSDAYDG